MNKHPRGVAADVTRAATIERLRTMGLLPRGASDRARSGLALMFAALVPFAALALGLWSQLHTGLASGSPDAGPVLRDSVVVLEVGTLVALVALPLGVAMTVGQARFSRRRPLSSPSVSSRQGLLGSAAVFVASLSALTAAGAGAANSGWYSPAALALPGSGLGHFVTLWIRAIVATITPAWIHPTLFARMPTG